MSTYTIEHAKSGRSSCKKCKAKIGEDELRIGTHSEDTERGYSMTSWNHPLCFSLPRKYATGANKMTAEQFLEDIIEDGEGILQDEEKKQGIATQIATKAGGKAAAGKDGDGKEDSFIGKLKAEHDAMIKGEGDGSKKRKSSGDGNESSAKRAKQIDIYDEIHKYNNEDLKNELRWNRQILTGTKDLLLTKVIDGRMSGRLATCVCGGKLKFSPAGEKVICNGTFDEDAQRKITCELSYTPEKAARATPWYTEEPTDEEKKEMERIEEEAKEGDGVATGANGEVEADSDLGKLMQKAESIKIETKDKASIKATTAAFVSMLVEDGKLDLPESEKDIKKQVGPMIMNNKDLSAPEIVKIVAKHFGYANVKKEKSAKKEEAMKEACAVADNAPLMMAFQELADLYFKEGNSNAGISYNKVVKALKDLPFQVTEENAKKLGKNGKDKVEGIGKASADKMHEFITTGTIQKLEEKRANS